MSGFILATVFTVFIAGQSFGQSDSTGNKDVKQVTAKNVNCGKFVDNNKNGVCDNFESRGVDGKGMNFVDANGDGICDHKADCTGPCKGNKNCCKGNQTCCGKGPCEGDKGMGNKHRKGCAGPCGSKQNPDKK